MQSSEELFADESFGPVAAVGKVEPADEERNDVLVDREGPGADGDDAEVQVWFGGIEAQEVGVGELVEVAGAQVHVEVVTGGSDGQSSVVGSVASAEHMAFVLADVSDEGRVNVGVTMFGAGEYESTEGVLLAVVLGQGGV